jgi:hypothetical protein
MDAGVIVRHRAVQATRQIQTVGRGEVGLGFPDIYHQTGQNHQSQLHQAGVAQEISQSLACGFFHNLFCHGA